jgi:AraC family transcriptional regulator of adaptative response/methylated-DNA-[protein]-cysteine methyltransferase
MDDKILTQADLDYSRIKRAIEYVTRNYTRQPDLDEIARHCAVSPFHFQRMFREWAGISPKKFLQYLTLKASKER